MNQEKDIGMDVHQATISVAVMDGSGKLIMECILETKAATIVEFIAGLRGTLSVTFEEGTSAAWLHDLLKPHVSHLVVCDPRRNALLKDGSKSDRIDARRRTTEHPATECSCFQEASPAQARIMSPLASDAPEASGAFFLATHSTSTGRGDGAESGLILAESPGEIITFLSRQALF